MQSCRSAPHGNEGEVMSEYVLCCACSEYVKDAGSKEWIHSPAIHDSLSGEMVSHGYCPGCKASFMLEIMEGVE